MNKGIIVLAEKRKKAYIAFFYRRKMGERERREERRIRSKVEREMDLSRC